MSEEVVVFVLLKDERKVKKILRGSPRLDWSVSYAPANQVKYITRMGKKPRWEYVYFGASKQEVLDLANAHRKENIKKLQAEIELLTSQLLNDDNITQSPGVIK